MASEWDQYKSAAPTASEWDQYKVAAPQEGLAAWSSRLPQGTPGGSLPRVPGAPTPIGMQPDPEAVGARQGLNDIGQGISGILPAILHPRNTFQQMGAGQRALSERASQDWKTGNYGNAFWHAVDSMIPGVGPQDAAITDEYQSGAPGAKTAAMSRAAVNATPLILSEAARPLAAPAAEVVGSGMDNAAIGASAADKAYGANPGRALFRNRIAGFSSPAISEQINEAIPGANAAHISDLQQFGVGKTLDLGTPVNQPFDSSIATETNPKTGVASPVQIAKARKLQTSINHIPDTESGQPTTALRNLNDYTPVEANSFKSSLYSKADYENPFKSSLANTALKGAAHNIKTTIDTAVPEAVESGQNLHDLMAARGTIAPRAGAFRLPTTREALWKHALQGGLTYGAQGARIAGNTLSTPEITRTPLIVGAGRAQPTNQLDGERQQQPDAGEQAVANQGSQDDSGSDLQDQHSANNTTTPDSHDFSVSAWLAQNPGGDADEARDHATSLGYTVVK